MIHRVHSLELAEVNRILELIQKRTLSGATVAAVVAPTTSPTGGFGALSASVATSVGATGATGPAGADGSAASMLVGVELCPEVLMDHTGNVLTDENGFALIGVKVSNSVVVGSGTSAYEVLNAS